MVAARVVSSANRTIPEVFHEYFANGGPRKTILNISKGQTIFRQGDPADCIFYIQKGRVKISVASTHGKEATLALQGQGGFIGEECTAASQPLRFTTAAAIWPCRLLRIDREELVRALDADKSLTQLFQSFLLARCSLMQADLIDHLLNSSEKRLARALILLSQLENGMEATVPHTTQETLSEMIGTTRSRVSFFMNRFRRMGYIQYSGSNSASAVTVYRSLFNILLKD
jgi:CRP-like cAMP-binding protein